MAYGQVVLALLFGILIGLLIAYLRQRSQSSSGEFVIKQDDEGRYSYILRLEEEPEGLHKSRYIFFKVTHSH